MSCYLRRKVSFPSTQSICLPLTLTIVGATSGLAGAASAWLGRYHLAIIGALGLVAVVAMAVRRNRAPFPPKAEHDPR
jgi:hypothetical protein